eukprot:scaffold71738_cov19-Tisochrysis_lutea.AAC.1
MHRPRSWRPCKHTDKKKENAVQSQPGCAGQGHGDPATTVVTKRWQQKKALLTTFQLGCVGQGHGYFFYQSSGRRECARLDQPGDIFPSMQTRSSVVVLLRHSMHAPSIGHVEGHPRGHNRLSTVIITNP